MLSKHDRRPCFAIPLGEVLAHLGVPSGFHFAGLPFSGFLWGVPNEDVYRRYLRPVDAGPGRVGSF